MMVRLIAATRIVNDELINKLGSTSPEELIMYCARVSSPNQTSGNPKLLGYCVENKHWSIFEIANMVVEITTSRAIAQQLLRHRSFTFQEFSQRYAEVQDFELYEARRQDSKNRQNSIDDLSDGTKEYFRTLQEKVWEEAMVRYDILLGLGVAKESARMVLPLNTQTRMYMNGRVRDWIHYINLRTGSGTQLEHQEIALGIKNLFVNEFRAIANALGWTDRSY